MSSKKVLVSGGAGYIGSHMIELLLSDGFEVVVIDNFSNSLVKKINPKVTFIESDIADLEVMKNIFTNHQIHAVFHFAAAIEAGASMTNPSAYYRNNVANSLNLIDLVIRYSPRSYFIFSSSAAVYEAKNDLLKEEDKKNPANIYGKTKLIVEETLFDCAKAHNLSYGILRYFNACGANWQKNLGENRQVESHLIPLLLRFLNRQDIEFFVNGNDYQTLDGTCVRDYVHVQDICSAHLKTLNHLENDGDEKCFNIGTGRGFSVLEIIKKAEEISGKKLPINYKKRREGDADSLVASNELARKVLGWQPEFSSLDEIISSAWKWEKLLFKQKNL